jgi:branched-chain amino acid aminotransferase
LQEAVLTLVKRSGLKSGILKVYGFYPEISFNILPPQRKFQVAVCLFSAEEALGRPLESAPRSVTACVSRWRRLDPQTVPIEAKVAANYVNGMVARMESREKGFDYAILLDTQGFITEGGTESFFLVRNGRLMTSVLGTVLQSITRKTLLEVAGTMGIETFTGLLNPAALDEADELFFSGTAAKLLPIRQVGDRMLNEVPGPLTRRLSERMVAITSGGDEQFRHWLFPA